MIQIGASDEFHFNLKVLAIDSITLLSGEKRKRIKLLHPGINQEVFWIEGVGSNSAPMDTRNMFITDGALELACYQYNDIIELETEKCNLRTGTREPMQTTFATIFPNPFTSELNIRPIDNKSFNLQIFDALGKLIIQQSFIHHSLHLNVITLPAGVYFLKMQDENGRIQIGQLVKQ